MRNLSKVLICSTIFLLPEFSFADSRGDMAASFLAGLLEAAQKSETQKKLQTQTTTSSNQQTMSNSGEFDPTRLDPDVYEYDRQKKSEQYKEEQCKQTSGYKFYRAAQGVKDMDQSVKLNDMALQMASPYDPDTARIRGERNMAAGMRTYFLNEYKKLGGKATSVDSINVPANPCK